MLISIFAKLDAKQIHMSEITELIDFLENILEDFDQEYQFKTIKDTIKDHELKYLRNESRIMLGLS